MENKVCLEEASVDYLLVAWVERFFFALFFYLEIGKAERERKEEVEIREKIEE